MEERNVHTFRNGAETRTLELGHLDTGEAYVTETGRGDITQFCYDAPANDVHLQLVEMRAAREAPRFEGAFPHALGVPRQRHHHARVVVPHAHQATPHVQPHGESPGPQPERAHHGLLRPAPEVHGREERVEPVGALLSATGDGRLLVEEKGPHSRTPAWQA